MEGGIIMPDTDLMIWLIAIAVFLILEIPTMGLTTIWFAAGSLIALFAAMADAKFTVQLVIFLAVSFLSLIFVRPSVCKKFNGNRKKTNIGGLVGRECKVIERIDNINQKGVVFLDGKEWTARSVEGIVIEPEEVVVVQEISGVKVMVSRLGQGQQSQQ